MEKIPFLIFNLNSLEEQTITKGQKIAEAMIRWIGSWRFIVIQTTLLVSWTIVNIIVFFEHWDPYP